MLLPLNPQNEPYSVETSWNFQDIFSFDKSICISPVLLLGLHWASEQKKYIINMKKARGNIRSSLCKINAMSLSDHCNTSTPNVREHKSWKKILNLIQAMQTSFGKFSWTITGYNLSKACENLDFSSHLSCISSSLHTMIYLRNIHLRSWHSLTIDKP